MPVFEKNNKAAVKNPKIVLRKFLEMLHNAKHDDKILCFQDACNSVGWRDSKIDYWVKKSPVFEILKKDIQSRIISRLNNGGLTGKFNATAYIWRSKQLGEKDESGVNHMNNGGSFEPPVIKFKKSE